MTCGSALRGRRGPGALAILGLFAGSALMGVLLGLQLSAQLPGPASAVLSLLSLLVLVPTYLAWSTWTAVRLLIGQRDLLAG
jgi:threonine/homoserine/homoserine lactone efflux protein